MLFALFPINTSTLADPELMARVAIAADEAGIESVFTGEHIVVPDPLAPPSHVPPDTVLVHPSTALAFCAAVTKRLKLGTGITLLPSHNPLVVAKEYGSLDHLSGGRLILGIGVGYVPLEYEVLGLPFANRGRRTDEYIDVLRAMWTQPSPSFDGEFVSFAGINAFPRPVQQPPPILVGGSSAAAYRRVVERGDGWIGGGGTPDGVRTAQDAIAAAGARYARPAELGEIELTVTPSAVLDRDLVAQFEDLGVTRLIVGFRAYGFDPDADGYLRWVDTVAALGASAG
jgi:probable F420-dependent oxidoreductase